MPEGIQYGVKSSKNGAVHYIHPDHPGIAFCGADVTPVPADSSLINRGHCVMCRYWYDRRVNSETQDNYWTEDRLRAEGRWPFNSKSSDQDAADWRARRAESAARRAMHPRDLIVLNDNHLS